MTKEDAIECLADGHTLWTVEVAEEVCQAVGLKLPKSLIVHYEGQKDANPENHFKGLTLNEDKPCDGVNSLDLSDWVMRKLGASSEDYFGRGRQARANARAIRKALNIEGGE